MNLNKVFLVGRVTSDVVLKATASGQAVTNFSVATNRTWIDRSGTKQEQAEFHNVVVWGRQAEIAGQFLTKGSMVLIEGRLQTRSWTDSNNQTRRTTEIVCETLQLGPRPYGQAGQGNVSHSESSASKAKGNVKSKGTDADALDALGDLEEEPLPEISSDEAEISAEDLPF